MKKLYLLAISLVLVLLTACGGETAPPENDTNTNDTTQSQEGTVELLEVRDALEVFAEGVEAEVFDIDTGLTFRVKRTTGGYSTLADVEPLTTEDTETMLYIAGGRWNRIRRPVIITVGERRIAASLTPFPHFGCDDNPHGVVVDNRSGGTGTGINLNSIRDNGITGVVDIYFFNSLQPGINRPCEMHQEAVLRAYDFEE